MNEPTKREVKLIAEIVVLNARFDVSLAMLKKYGDHLGCCHHNLKMGKCNCGFLAAIKGD